ncbi:MAG: hypothetical protein C0408_01805 [Odoribacter sp.]|nr:hypothetical protein [Odoribacter sp.]
MDNLEKFIKDNRADLDKYETPENSWGRIKAGLPARKIRIPVWLSAAAVFTIIFVTSVILYTLNRKKDSTFTEVFSGKPGLKETEVYYNSLVNTLYLEARPLLTGQPEIARELRSDMAQLDSICVDLKKDLKDNVANQEVIEALIQNYRIKLQLLEEMLNLLRQNENKQEKNESHEI